jgi:hypothetical protein
MTARSVAPTSPVTLTERAPVPARTRRAIVGAVLGVAGLAWIVTDVRMAGMDAGPGTVSGRPPAQCTRQPRPGGKPTCTRSPSRTMVGTTPRLFV